MTNTNNLRQDKSTLVKLALGVSPIPVVGEIALAAGFYDLLKDKGFGLAGIPAALLTRFGMYQQFYLPMYEALKDKF